MIFFMSLSFLCKADNPANVSVYPLMSLIVAVNYYAALPNS